MNDYDAIHHNLMLVFGLPIGPETKEAYLLAIRMKTEYLESEAI